MSKLSKFCNKSLDIARLIETRGDEDDDHMILETYTLMILSVLEKAYVEDPVLIEKYFHEVIKENQETIH